MLSKKSNITDKDIKQAIRHEEDVVKGHLKTMTQNSGAHKTRTLGRILKYGVASFGRNIWLSVAATLVMTITLLILMITVFASVVLSSTADTMREKIDITVYFKPGTSEQTLSDLSEIMSADSNVKNVEVATSNNEFNNFLSENTEDEELISILQDEDMKKSLLSSMPSTMRIFVYDTDNLDSVKNLVATNQTFIDNIDSKNAPTYEANQSEIATVSSWANIAKNGGLILGAVFLIISILVIFNTIRMAIFSRREEIYMMKLVGADNNFIRGPFLVEAQLCGIISGVLASTLGVIGFNFLAPKLSGYGIDISRITSVLGSTWLIVVFLAMISIGILVGSISARLAIHKYLR